MTQITFILIICTSIFACANTSKNGKVAELKEQKTSNVSQKDSSIMITCDTTQIDFRLEKILLESKYLPYHKIKGYKSLLLWKKTNGKKREISFYNLCLETSHASEVRRFLIENHQIMGLICLPGLVEDYMSTEEYDMEERNVRID